MGVRRQARECALQIVFQLDDKTSPTTADVDDAVEHFFENFDAPDEKARALAETMARGVGVEREALDALVQQHSPRWKMPRMAMVDRNILRLGAWELQKDAETPARVIIDEAVEIAKRYGAEQSGSFVNGVLDGIARELGRFAAKGASKASGGAAPDAAPDVAASDAADVTPNDA